MGLFTAVVFDCGNRNGSIYGGTVAIYGDNGSVTNVSGSIFPNNWGTGATRPGIQSGVYFASYGSMAHRGGPGIIINGNDYVSTNGSNPAQHGLSLANYIHVHMGDSGRNRGSTGCVTTNPNQGNPFSGLSDGEQGVVIVMGCQ